MQNQNIVETTLDECCFIAGGRKSGKTNLGILLVDQLLKNDVQVKVIDSSRQWLKRSSVPYYVKVSSARVSSCGLFAFWDLPNLWDCVYDCSRLTVSELGEFAQGMMEHDFQEAVLLDDRSRIGHVISQIVVNPTSIRIIKSVALNRVSKERKPGLPGIVVNTNSASRVGCFRAGIAITYMCKIIAPYMMASSRWLLSSASTPDIDCRILPSCKTVPDNIISEVIVVDIIVVAIRHTDPRCGFKYVVMNSYRRFASIRVSCDFRVSAQPQTIV